MQPDWILNISKVTVHPIAMPLVSPFQTSFGTQTVRGIVLVRVETANGAVGWGEVTTDFDPGYSYETTHTAIHILNDFLVPRLMESQPLHSDKRWLWLESVRGHPLAKHGLISAIMTAAATELNMALADMLQIMANASERRAAVDVGVSIGIQPTVEDTLARVRSFVQEGYRRIKLKIKPGWDVLMVREVRHYFPDVLLMADANSAYTLEDVKTLKQLDEFNLMMIEQPLAYYDIYEHSLLQPQLSTPICLDESLHTVNDLQVAHKLGACRVVNLKPQRVGGLYEAVKMHNFCRENGIDLWIGGMLETGIGRSISLALASLPGITMPGDLSATKRYYNPDIADPPFELNPGTSTITVPTAPGVGVTVIEDRVREAEARFQELVADKQYLKFV